MKQTESEQRLHSVIIPCYKSDQTIRKVVELTMAEFERMGRNRYEFVLVDDNSPDGGKTVRVLRELVRGLSLRKSGGAGEKFRAAQCGDGGT